MHVGMLTSGTLLLSWPSLLSGHLDTTLLLPALNTVPVEDRTHKLGSDLKREIGFVELLSG